MNGPKPLDLLDRLVDAAARLLDAIGLNGTRLRWRWTQRRRNLGERSLRSEVLWRSARGRHKMCPSCRALVPRAAGRCTECDASLAGVRAPGLGRAISNLLPGATAVTSLILLVNGALFVLMLLAAREGPDGAPQGFAHVMRFDPTTLLRFGAGWGVLTFGAGEWWRLLTPVFLHSGLLHFAFNSYVLMQLGPLVESEFGTERFVFAYLACGVAGNVASQALSPGGLTVGASGAIFGLVGLLLVHGKRRGGAFGTGLGRGMTEYAVYALIFSFLPGIDWRAHLGGLAMGAGLGAVIPSGPFRSRATGLMWEGLVLLTLAVALFAFFQVARH